MKNNSIFQKLAAMAASSQDHKVFRDELYSKITERINRERMKFGILALHPDRAGSYILQDFLVRAPSIQSPAEEIEFYFGTSFKPKKYFYLPLDSTVAPNYHNKAFDGPITDQNIKEKVFAYMDMVFPFQRDNFLNRQFTSIAFELVWSHDRFKLLILLTQQCLSVDSIQKENEDFRIQGYLHDSSVFIYCIKLIDAHKREFFIGYNRVSLSNDRARFQIDIPQFLIRGLDLNAERPSMLEFYYAPGQQIQHSGQGNDLNHAMFNAANVTLQLLYSMPFVYSQSKSPLKESMQQNLLIPEPTSNGRRESRFFEAEDAKQYQNMGNFTVDFNIPSQNNGTRIVSNNVENSNGRPKTLARNPTNPWNSPRPDVIFQAQLNNRTRKSNLFRNRSNSPQKDLLDSNALDLQATRTPLQKLQNNSNQYISNIGSIIQENSMESSRFSPFSAMGNSRSDTKDNSRPLSTLNINSLGLNIDSSTSNTNLNAQKITGGPFGNLRILGSSTTNLVQPDPLPAQVWKAENQFVSVVPQYQVPNPSDLFTPVNIANSGSNFVHNMMNGQILSQNNSNSNMFLPVAYPVLADVTSRFQNNNSSCPNIYGSFHNNPPHIDVTTKSVGNAYNNILQNNPYINSLPSVSQIQASSNQTKQSQTLFPLKKSPLFTQIPSMSPHSGYSNNYERFAASLLTGNGFIDKAGLLDLQKIESLLPSKPLERVDHFIHLYNTMEMPDVILRLGDQELKAHKMVLVTCPWFKEQLARTKSQVNELILIQLPDWFRLTTFKKVLKFLYYSSFEEEELHNLDAFQAREVLLTASALKLYYLMSLILCRAIIPKITKELCIELLKDSYRRDLDNEDTSEIWKTLNNFCREFFATHSKSIIHLYRSKLSQLEPELLFKIVSRALLKPKDQDHLFELLSLLTENQFASNVMEILARVSKNCEGYRRFDSKYLPCLEAILALDPRRCYETDLITVDPIECINITADAFSDIKSTPQKGNSSKKLRKQDFLNHFELNLKRSGHGGELDNNGEKGLAITRSDPNYVLKTRLDTFKARTIVTELFDSETRAWSLIIDIDNEQRVSLFLQERGGCFNATNAEANTHTDFTSVRFTFQIKDEGNEYESTIFFSYPNNQYLAIGHRKFFNLPYLLNKNALVVRVWIEEFSVYSCSLQHIASRFTDLWKENEKTQENKLNAPKSYSIYSKEIMNEPQNNERITYSEKRRKSLVLLERNLVRQATDLVVDNCFETADDQSKTQVQSSKDAYGPIQIKKQESLAMDNKPFSFAAKNNEKKHFNNLSNLLPKLTNSNACDSQDLSITRQNTLLQFPQKPSVSDIQLDVALAPELSFYDLNPYDLYYLMLSDRLQIEHERFLIYFLYKYVINKPNDIITLLICGVRFSYLELTRIFNLGRDHLSIRQNAYFKSKLDYQIQKRMHCVEPLERPRRYYNSTFLHEWDFKEDLVKWLLESDHHQGFRLKNDELRKELADKENRMKELEERESKLVLEMRRLRELTKGGHAASIFATAGEAVKRGRYHVLGGQDRGTAGQPLERTNSGAVAPPSDATLSALEQFAYERHQRTTPQEPVSISQTVRDKLNQMSNNCNIF